MPVFRRLVFGDVSFSETDDYRDFQFRFLCLVILIGALITGLLVLGSWSAANTINPAHVRSMTLFTSASLLAWWVLRGRPGLFHPVAWAYECLCILEYVSALYYVSEDEFRVVWFLTNIPGVYLLLGQGPGLAVTVLTALGLMLGNAWLPAPYSHNAMATLLFSIVYLGMFFHLFSARALSYYRQLNSSRRQLLQLALHDHLTGVFNARAFYQTCSAQAGLARYAVIFIDLDHFKSVNDTHGHAAGDAVLRVVAALLGGLVRSQDCLGRVGGEEFCIFLPDTDRQTAMQLAAHIREAVAALPIAIADGKSISVTASLGVASHCGSQEDFQQVLQQADSAMYQAKQAGRNRVSCLDAA